MAQGSLTTTYPKDPLLQRASLPTYPHRHKGYVTAYAELQQLFELHNAVILQGPEKTGKTTLAAEFAQHYQQQGIKIIRFTEAVNTPRQLYALLADALGVPKLKKDLVQALRQAKVEDRYCLVVCDGDAVNSSTAVSEALHKLCDPTAKTAGAIKLLVVSTDYLVIHTKNTYETDFHDWIKPLVKLKKLTADDLEALTRYLAEQHNCPVPQYELGTDLLLLEQSEGRIQHLIELIEPLLEQSVIKQQSAVVEEKGLHPLDSRNARYYFLAMAIVIVVLAGYLLKQLISSPLEKPEIAAEDEENRPVFLEETTTDKNLITKPKVQLPTLGDGTETSTTATARPEKAALMAELQPEPEKPVLVPAKESVRQPLPVLQKQPVLPSAELVAQVSAAVDNWIRAWAARSPQQYLSHYTDDFTGSEESHQVWVAQRTNSLLNPKWIQLKREALQNISLQEKEVRVDFWLDYHSSSGYRDRTFKRLVLRQEKGAWRIAEETNLTVVRR